jgi:hypothetical protein
MNGWGTELDDSRYWPHVDAVIRVNWRDASGLETETEMEMDFGEVQISRWSLRVRVVV